MSWYCQTPEEFQSAVLAATAIVDRHEREYQLKQMYQPPKAKTRIHGYKIIQQFGDWYIVSSGILHGPMNYLIDKSRLNEPDWVEHIKGKTWSDHNEFMEAYRFALRHWRSPSESVRKRRQRSSP